jgi:hypothetical protein
MKTPDMIRAQAVILKKRAFRALFYLSRHFGVFG